jgi:hypothetical protein
MSNSKTYTLDQLSEKLNWHRSALKVILRKMNVDPEVPIEEEDAAAVAEKLKKAWPVGK